ncbi:MAG TPA: phospholipid carrier-dependent glycosyltransferase [Opitutaceae bacterium]
MDDTPASPLPGLVLPRQSPFGRPPLVLAVLSFVWILVVGHRLAQGLSPTTDEPTHLSAGLSGWQGDYRQSTGNLFFAQKWEAWPAFHQGVAPPAEALQRELGFDPVPIGTALVFSSGADPRLLLTPGRTMTVWLCVGTGILVWAWAVRLRGFWAGGLAALLFATSPVVLANGVLVTTDTAAAFWSVAALMAYAWMLRRPGTAAAAVTGISLGFLLLTKFSAAAWGAGAALLLAWEIWRRRGSNRTLALLAAHAFAAAAAWLTIWTFFGWQFQPEGHAYLGPGVPAPAWVSLLDRCHALPEPYLRDLVTFQGMLEPRPAFLLGHYRVGGFWYFFPVAFLAKSTVAMLLALGACAFFRPKGAPARLPPSLAPLAAGAAGFLAVALFSPLDIGVRHILPLFALASVAGGVGLVECARRGMAAQVAVAALAVGAAAEGFAARAKPEAWFNLLAGGPMNGHRILVDSSLEWGGDLPDLVAWEASLRTSDQTSPLFVSLLGPVGHEHSGLNATNLDWAFENGRIRAGYFVFGATRLAGGPPEFYGRWDQALADEWAERGASSWRGPVPHHLAELAVARLAASCRSLVPTERIGPIYFVFRLDQAALDRALGVSNP